MAKVAEVLEVPATVTERGQTTVPAAIRKMLNLGKRGHVVFRGMADGTVILAKSMPQPQKEDPVVGKFLAFLAKDMADRPQNIQSVSPALVASARSLVEDVSVDLDAPLPDDDE